MNDLAKHVYQDRIKYLRHRIVNVGAILLIFILAFILLIFKENKKLIAFETEEKKIEDILRDCPWDKLRQVYEGSFINIKDYLENHSRPCAILCAKVSSEKIPKLKEFDNENIDSIKFYINFSAKKLAALHNNMRLLFNMSKKNKSFDNLNKVELERLVNLLNFRWSEKEIQNISKGIKYSSIMAKDLINKSRYDDSIISSNTKKIYQEFLNLDNPIGTFLSFDFVLMNNYNPYSKVLLSKENINEYNSLIYTFKKSKFQNYNDLVERKIVVKNKKHELLHGENTKLPIINFYISLNQIVIFGGIINLGILLYFYFMAINLRTLSYKLETALEETLSLEDKQALFFGLDYQIKYKWFYIILNILFFSALPIISIILGRLFFKQELNVTFFVGIVICIFNIYVSFIISKTLFQLNKT